MKFKLFIFFCILQSISGASLSQVKIGYPPLSDRIVGGVDAADGQAPYQCSLQRGGQHFCGCVIISDKWILSAAHCLSGEPNNTEVLVGTSDLQSGGTRYATEKFIVHEKHGQPAFANDIGLIEVDKIEFNKKVQPIKYSSKFVDSGVNLLATGWGRLSANGEIPQRLQAINLTSLSNDECKAAGTNPGDSHLCTFTKAGQGICFGDSGGPLVLGDEVVGLANWVYPCAIGLPDGFARISYLYEWIITNINGTK